MYVILPAPGWHTGNFATVIATATTKQAAIELAEKEPHAVAYLTGDGYEPGSKISQATVALLQPVRAEKPHEPSMFERLYSRRQATGPR